MVLIAALLIERHRRRRVMRALSQSEARYRGILEDQSDLLCRFHADGTLTFVNEAYCRYFGKVRAELIGATFWPLIPPEEHDRLRESLAKIARTGEARTIEHQVLGSRGEICWQQWIDRGIFDERGRLVEYQSVGRDITERKKREEEHGQLVAARAAEEALREADRRKDLFLAMLAHELRNPLNSIRMATELMRIGLKNEEKMIRARDVIERQTHQLIRLVDDLLDVSRITQDKIQFRLEPLDLVTVVSHAVDAAEPLFTGSGVWLSMNLCQRPVRVRGDKVRLAQVISNLLSNAAKFTQPEGSVSLTMSRNESGVTLCVADNGVGIPRDMQGRIFDLFTQVDSSRARSQGGLGIGLTLVKRIVEVHGGSIDVESAGEGQGSRFTVRLPVLIDLVDTPVELVAVARVGSPSAFTGG